MNNIDEQRRTTEESQKVGRPLDKSRRSFAKAGVIAPVLMTLTSKTALGSVYQCTISGVQSGNVSSHSEDMSVCRTGRSPNTWLANVDTATTPNYVQWSSAGVCPFRIERKGASKYHYKKGSNSCTAEATGSGKEMCAYLFANLSALIVNNISSECGEAGNVDVIKATTFASIFDPNASDTLTFWDALAGTSPTLAELRRNACVAYLNASANYIQDISPADVIKLYRLCAFHEVFLEGSLAVTNEVGAAELLANLYLP